jgi:glutamate dehydrogenase (NAD(P)+)
MGALGIPVGGAKFGLDIDPTDPQKAALMARFVRALRPLFLTCTATGEDLGVSQDEVQAAFDEADIGLSAASLLPRSGDADAAGARLRTAFANLVDGIPIVAVAGGFGVAICTVEALQVLGIPVAGATASIQGFGTIGSMAARYLARSGLRVVAIADVHGTVANPNGLDVERLLASRTPRGEIDRAQLRPGDAELGRDVWLGLEVDVLVPAAVADAINVANCNLVTAKLVVEAANIPTSPEAERTLARRGILVLPDFIANSGALGWWIWTILGTMGTDADAAPEGIAGKLQLSTRVALTGARAQGASPRTVAELQADQVLDGLARSHGEQSWTGALVRGAPPTGDEEVSGP